MTSRGYHHIWRETCEGPAITIALDYIEVDEVLATVYVENRKNGERRVKSVLQYLPRTGLLYLVIK